MSLDAIGNLAGLLPPDTSKLERGEDAARGAEELFAKLLLKEMRRAMPSDMLGPHGDAFFDLLDGEIAKRIADSGQLGLADFLTQHMPGETATTGTPSPLDHAPVDGRISSGFGPRIDPFTGEAGSHHGLDLAAPEGTPIEAVRGGTVTFAGEQGGLGNLVVVDHGNGLSTRYGHCARIDVTVGDRVNQGQQLGTVGSTGRSTGAHLHLEARRNGRAVDPARVFRLAANKIPQTTSEVVRQDTHEGMSGEPTGTRRGRP